MSQPTLHGPWLLEALSRSFPRSCGEFLEEKKIGFGISRIEDGHCETHMALRCPKAVFLFSVLAFPEYSLLEPPRAKSELLFVYVCVDLFESCGDRTMCYPGFTKLVSSKDRSFKKKLLRKILRYLDASLAICRALHFDGCTQPKLLKAS